jgi:serine phosphatase RsbU (regulator of sigma subunit)
MIAMAVMTLLKQFFKLPPTSLKHAISGFHEQLQELMEDEVLDVFDVELAILSLDKRTSVLTYVGSGVNTLIKTESGVKQFKSRKSQLILGTVKEEKIQLKKGEQLFVSSDGIYDQFDAENKKRLGSRGFLNMIERAPANNTFNSFMEQFEAFRGEAKQLDDHSMIVLTI